MIGVADERIPDVVKLRMSHDVAHPIAPTSAILHIVKTTLPKDAAGMNIVYTEAYSL
jgi:hypothetical protein